MKRVFTKLTLALAIGGFIYFIAAGGETVPNLLKGLEKTGSEKQTGTLTEIKDKVFGSFPSLGTSTKDFNITEKYLGRSNDNSDSDIKNKEGPLSNLLNNFSKNQGVAIEENNENNSTTTPKNNRSTSTEKIVNETSNLPEFSLMCFPKIERVCNENGCEENNPKARFILINDPEDVIHRCLSESCRAFKSQSKEFENYINYQIPGKPGVMLGRSTQKTGEGQSNFVELETNGTEVTIKYGYCLEK